MVHDKRMKSEIMMFQCMLRYYMINFTMQTHHEVLEHRYTVMLLTIVGK